MMAIHFCEKNWVESPRKTGSCYREVFLISDFFFGWFTIVHLFAYINCLNVDTDKWVNYDEKPYTASPFFDEVLQGSSFETKSTNYLSDVGLLAAIKYRLDEPC